MRRVTVLAAAFVVLSVAVARAETADERPALLWIDAEGARHEMPLVSSHAKVDVRGPIAQVQLNQVFANPNDVPIESVYVFPLPDKGAVGSMTMRIGDRTIRAKIKKRDEARAIYEKAREEGKTASLLEQQRPNVFTQSVANILPGEQIEVALTYDLLLGPVDGLYELAVPTVVGPRYMAESVKDAGAISPPIQVGKKGTGNTLGLDLDIDAGLPIEDLYSPTHTIVTTRLADDHYRVALAEGAMKANKDFVLQWRIEVKKPALAVLAHKEPGATWGHVALVVQPPRTATKAPRGKRELVFIVDTSGSMEGAPIDLAKSAMRYALARLGRDDAFRIFEFNSHVDGFEGGALLTASKDNVKRALAYVDDLDAGGGTEMIHGVKAALAGVPEGGRTRYVCFMTDGYIGNETEMFAAIDAQIDHATYLFSFGVGSSVNRYLLDGLAEHGGGVARYLLLEEDPAVQIEEFFAQVETPLLGGLRVEWDGVEVEDPTPSRMKHLFAGQPVVFAGRYRAGGQGTVVVRGRSGDQDVVLRIPVVLSGEGGDGAVLARLWARRRIEELEASQVAGEDPEVVAAITNIALEHALMSRYTSFVAVEEIRRAKERARRVDVPVELPEGVGPGAIDHNVVIDTGGDAEEIVIEERAPMIDAATAGRAYEGELLMLSGASSGESIYIVDARQERWRASLDLGLARDALGDEAVTSLSFGLERRTHDLVALGAAATFARRADHADVTTLLGTLARWALFGVLDLRLGAGAAFVDGDAGLAWQVRFGVPLPIRTRIRPELELRLDRAHLDDEGLLGVGGGLGLRF